MSYGLDDDHGGPDPSQRGDGGGASTALSYDYDGDTSSTSNGRQHRALGELPARVATTTAAAVLRVVLPASAARAFARPPPWSSASVVARDEAHAAEPSRVVHDIARRGAALPPAKIQQPGQHVQHVQPHADRAAVAARFWRGKAAHLLIAGEYDDDATATVVAASRPVADTPALAIDSVASVVQHESAAPRLQRNSTAAAPQPPSLAQLAQQQLQQPQQSSQQAEPSRQPTQSQHVQQPPPREPRHSQKTPLARELRRSDVFAAAVREPARAPPSLLSSDPALHQGNASVRKAMRLHTATHALGTTLGNAELLRRRKRR